MWLIRMRVPSLVGYVRQVLAFVLVESPSVVPDVLVFPSAVAIPLDVRVVHYFLVVDDHCGDLLLAVWAVGLDRHAHAPLLETGKDAVTFTALAFELRTFS